MKHRTYVRDGCLIIRIEDDIKLNSRINELNGIVKKTLESGEKNIALAFTEPSQFSSDSINVLVKCLALITEKGGKLALIQPKKNILEVFRIIGLSKKVKVYRSEQEIGELET
jgi:anti-anti-sigma factor